MRTWNSGIAVWIGRKWTWFSIFSKVFWNILELFLTFFDTFSSNFWHVTHSGTDAILNDCELWTFVWIRIWPILNKNFGPSSFVSAEISPEIIWIFPRFYKFRYLQIFRPFRCTIHVPRNISCRFRRNIANIRIFFDYFEPF